MRIERLAVLVGLLWAATGSPNAGAASGGAVTVNGMPVARVVTRGGHLLIPFRVPLEQIGATVTWSDAQQTGTAALGDRELLRTTIGSELAYVDGVPRSLSVAPALVDDMEFVPVELLPEISTAALSISPDGTQATVTGFTLDGIEGTSAGAASGDPDGRALYVWVWLLPVSAVLCFAAYMALRAQLELDRRSGGPRRP